MTAPAEPGTYAGTRFGGTLTIVVRDRDGGWTEDGKDVTEAIEQFAPFYRVEIVGPPSEALIREMERDIDLSGVDHIGTIDAIADLARYLLQRGWRR